MRLITQSVRAQISSCFFWTSSTNPSLSLPSLVSSNILACHVKSCNANNFPLLLSNVEIEIREAEYNEDFLKGFWPKIEWAALVDTAKTVSSQPAFCQLPCIS